MDNENCSAVQEIISVRAFFLRRILFCIQTPSTGSAQILMYLEEDSSGRACAYLLVVVRD